MRVIRLAAALTLLWGGGLRAQEQRPAAAAPVQIQRPADVVAELARQALSRPDDGATWGALARSIPDMALEGGADLESTFEAARLADSLTAEALQPKPAFKEVGSTPVETQAVPPILARRLAFRHALSVGLERVGDPRFALPVLAVLLSALLLVHASRRRRPRRPVEAPGRGRVWTVRTLASGGVEIQEIARRTGLAQDAVRMALGMGAAPAASPTAPEPAPAARRRSAPAEARLRREIAAGARRLRDGRLTYGGGVS